MVGDIVDYAGEIILVARDEALEPRAENALAEIEAIAIANDVGRRKASPCQTGEIGSRQAVLLLECREQLLAVSLGRLESSVGGRVPKLVDAGGIIGDDEQLGLHAPALQPADGFGRKIEGVE